jgi:hypothetical protein
MGAGSERRGKIEIFFPGFTTTTTTTTTTKVK